MIFMHCDDVNLYRKTVNSFSEELTKLGYNFAEDCAASYILHLLERNGMPAVHRLNYQRVQLRSAEEWYTIRAVLLAHLYTEVENAQISGTQLEPALRFAILRVHQGFKAITLDQKYPTYVVIDAGDAFTIVGPIKAMWHKKIKNMPVRPLQVLTASD